jgi:methylglutaconyl-CoA hydratase
MSQEEPLLIVHREGTIEHVVLNRPGVRNAFNRPLVAELHGWARRAASDPGVRAAVLTGAGKAFCAGADLAWMLATIAQPRHENVGDARELASMFESLDSLPFPLIGRVQGPALGGGTGLVAVCDIVVAAEPAVFGFTEVKLGLVPSVIAPYVLAKIGRSAARELFLSGARFDAARARAIGLVHQVVPEGDLDATVGRHIREILTAGPEAVGAAKRLIGELWPLSTSDAQEITSEVIASRRVSEEGQEGMKAFLEKRRPGWVVEEP